MTVTVKLFAAARDIIGSASIDLELPQGATVAEVRAAISHQYPAAERLIARSAIALNHDYALDSDVVPQNAELAVIPPVSGG